MNRKSSQRSTETSSRARTGGAALPLLAVLPLLPILVQGAMIAIHHAYTFAEERQRTTTLAAQQKTLPPAALTIRQRSLAICGAFLPAGESLTATVERAGIRGEESALYWSVNMSQGDDNQFVARLVWDADTGKLCHLIRASIPADGNPATKPALSNAKAARTRAVAWLHWVGAQAPAGGGWKSEGQVIQCGPNYLVHLKAAGDQHATLMLNPVSGLPSEVSLSTGREDHPDSNRPAG